MDIKEKLALITPPGSAIKETIQTKEFPSFTTGVLMNSLNMGKEEFHLLLQGKIRISNEIAYTLEECLGVHAQSWVNLQEQYEEELASLFMIAKIEKRGFKRGLYFFMEHLL